MAEARVLEINAHLGRDLSVAGPATATASAATAARTEPAEAAIERQALTKEWRRQIADWIRKVYVIEQVLKVQRKLHAVALCFRAASAWSTYTTARNAEATTASTAAAASTATTAASSGNARSACAFSAATATLSCLTLTCLAIPIGCGR